MLIGQCKGKACVEHWEEPKRDTLVDELKPDDLGKIWEHILSLELRVNELESPGFSKEKSEAAALGQGLSNLQKLERRIMLERPPSAFLVVSAIRRYRDAAATLRQRMGSFSNDALRDFAHAVDAIENSKDYE